MSTTSRLGTTSATSTPHWRYTAACRGWELEPFFSTKQRTQERLQGLCRRCPGRSACLSDTLSYEGHNYRWGVAGGLTTVQRRALYCEGLLGHRPNLGQAAVLASPVWMSRMMPLRHRGLTPEQIAVALRGHGVIATPVTVRVAVWWAGGKGGVMPRRQPGDGRLLWELVRDECRNVVKRLREAGASAQDVAAYLQVAPEVLRRAGRAWRAETAEEVAA